MDQTTIIDTTTFRYCSTRDSLVVYAVVNDSRKFKHCGENISRFFVFTGFGDARKPSPWHHYTQYLGLPVVENYCRCSAPCNGQLKNCNRNVSETFCVDHSSTGVIRLAVIMDFTLYLCRTLVNYRFAFWCISIAGWTFIYVPFYLCKKIPDQYLFSYN